MHPASILIVQHDPAIANALASQLDLQFRSVRLARSVQEVRSALPDEQVDALVADLETVALQEIAELSRDLNLAVICTHRVPDEQMWTEALEAGALDMCPASDTSAIVSSVCRNLAAERSHAAA